VTERSSFVIQTSPAEMQAKAAWVQSRLLGDSLPFSFDYAGRGSSAVLPGWEGPAVSEALTAGRTRRIRRWADPLTGLEVRCVAVEYADYPAVEWTLYFKNNGSAPTLILESIQSLDVEFPAAGQEFVLRSMRGDDCSAESYQPIQAALPPGASRGFAPTGGRASNGAFPYFNLAWGEQGAILCLGWPGQWSAAFACDEAGCLRVTGGQEHTRLQLLPGEEIRSPLTVLFFWEGSPRRAQNLWRRWMTAHNLPRPGGQLSPTFSSACLGLHQSEEGEKQFIDQYVAGGIALDYWWMDAGWYPGSQWSDSVGTWEPDPQRFPRGIRAVSDYAHSKGMRMVLWFEPERVAPGTWLFTQHPEWLLSADAARPGNVSVVGPGTRTDCLLNLGIPAARAWLTDHIDRFLTEQGIDLYRQDFNFDPLPFWVASDAAAAGLARQGMTENLHVQGYLAFWDELLRRNPRLLIDTCSSGGRRNDLETLRRSIPLLRSDFQAPGAAGLVAFGLPVDKIYSGNQCHGFTLPDWIPHYGTGDYYNDTYSFRSHLSPTMGIGYDPTRLPPDWAAFRKTLADWRTVSTAMLGDYYPLSAYSLEEDQWMAWQFFSPETGEGMLQAFRRTRCPEDTVTLRLHGLDPDAHYTVVDLDRQTTGLWTGADLMTAGLPVTLPGLRQAALLHYRQVINEPTL
jgi:alpha-galactosidase